MTGRNFNRSKFPLYKLYVLLTRLLPEYEHEELRGEIEEIYRELLKKQHSRTDAMLRTSWQALTFVTGIWFDNTVIKTGSFQEEVLRLQGFLNKLIGILCLLLFPVLYFTPKSISLFILFAFVSILFLSVSFEWTFNHRKNLKIFGIIAGVLIIASLLLVLFNPQQQQILSLSMSAIGVTLAPWLASLTVILVISAVWLLFAYLILWITCGAIAYLVAGAWYLRSIFFK